MAANAKTKQPVTKGVAKVPVVMQMEALECGAAALTMILAYYQKWIPLEIVRADCGVSRDGSNARNIMVAARSYGFIAKGYKWEPETLKEKAKFPCIIHWNFNHFVVCCGMKGNKVYINDPAKGNTVVTMEEFDKAFTGVCLQFEPSEQFEPSGKKKSVLEFARKRMEGTKAAVLFLVLTSIITTLCGIVSSAFSRVFMDQLLTGYNREWLYPFLGGLFALALIQLMVGWINAVYSMRINGKMAAVGAASYFWKVLRLPMEFFSQRNAGDIQGRQGLNAIIAQELIGTLAPMALNTIMMIFYFIVMIRYSPLLTVIGLTSVVLNIFVSRVVSDKRINITRVMQRDAANLASSTVSAVQMIETIKAAGAENGYFAKWSDYQASVNTQNTRYAKLDSYLGLIPKILSQLANAIVLIVGVSLSMRGQFTVGMLMAFQGFLSSFMVPAEQLIAAGQTFQEMRTNMERIEDVMTYPEQITEEMLSGTTDEDKKTSYNKLGGEVELKNVTFGYSRLGEPVIKDFAMHLERGSRVAFVGASGCGKSTLSKLISGLYEPWEGEILFDGKPIRNIDRNVFTGSVAVVDQDITLFEDTIRENIRMWDESIEDFEVIMAARDAQIHEDIMKRDGGYDYKLISGGRDFSGGQRQRIEIARVLAADPTIIILDEATSALDAKTEYDVVKAIKDRGITCIVIAHRLSTVRDCDEIIVLDHGNVVERGTHDELMAHHGVYEQLVTSE